MHSRINFLPVAVLTALLLSGCVGEPQTFYAADPVEPEHHVVARTLVRSMPTVVAPTLSAGEKQRLFQDFQHLQSSNNQATIAEDLAP